MSRSDFEKLRVFRDAEALADRVWDVVQPWEPLATHTLGRQLVRAADSVGANIAEGAGRGSFRDNRRFVRIARGSLYEVKFFLRRAHRRGLLTEEQVGPRSAALSTELRPLIDRLAPMLNAYLRSIGSGSPSTDHGPRTTDDA